MFIIFPENTPGWRNPYIKTTSDNKFNVGTSLGDNNNANWDSPVVEENKWYKIVVSQTKVQNDVRFFLFFND
mgnify:FL=1